MCKELIVYENGQIFIGNSVGVSNVDSIVDFSSHTMEDEDGITCWLLSPTAAGVANARALIALMKERE